MYGIYTMIYPAYKVILLSVFLSLAHVGGWKDTANINVYELFMLSWLPKSNAINNIPSSNSYMSELIEHIAGSYVFVFKEGSTTDFPIDFVILWQRQEWSSLQVHCTLWLNYPPFWEIVHSNLCE